MADRGGKDGTLLLSVYVRPSIVRAILSQADLEYPDECCGILVGKRRGKDVYVQRSVPGKNIAKARKERNYQIDWHTLFETLRGTRKSGQEIIGFYHSHPDGSTHPSGRDRDFAWVDHSYLIVSMVDGRGVAITSWRKICEGSELVRGQILHTSQCAGNVQTNGTGTALGDP